MKNSIKYSIEDSEIINGIHYGDIVDENGNVIIEKGYLEDNQTSVEAILAILNNYHMIDGEIKKIIK